MIVTINNKTYRYFFKHLKNRLYYEVDSSHELFVDGKDRKNIRAVTTCCIQNKVEVDRIEGLPVVEWQDIAGGYSFCSRSDRFVKETGRVLALTRALSNLDLPLKEQELFMDHYLNRNLDERFNRVLYRFINGFLVKAGFTKEDKGVLIFYEA